jgi:hypothetical protein
MAKIKKGTHIVSKGCRIAGPCYGTALERCRYRDKPAWKVQKNDGRVVVCYQKNMSSVV